MDKREKILKTFDAIIATKEPDYETILKFLIELNSYVYEDIFVMMDGEEFSVKHVEGDTFFNAGSRVLYLGTNRAEKKKEIFDTLVSVMQYYRHRVVQKERGDDSPMEFKDNHEKALALEYIAAAITCHFLDDFPWPESELADYMKEYGLIDDLILIRVFAKKYVDLVEYEGDFRRLLEKIKETIAIISEIHGETCKEEDEAMEKTILEHAKEDIDASLKVSDEDREALIKNILEGLTL